MDDVPVTGKTIIDSITKGLLWLDRQIELIVGPTPQPVSALAPADLTDVQLHHAIHDVGATLLNNAGRPLPGGYAHHSPIL
jgi:hypothetical protein